MHHFDDVRYLENIDFQAVELPYSSGELSMVILCRGKQMVAGNWKTG